MKHVTLAALAILGLTIADTPRFAPEEKSSVEKTIRSEVKFEATSFTITLDGREIPKEQVGQMGLKFDEVSKYVLTDRYVKTKDGRPIELDRTFDELVQTKHETKKKPGDSEDNLEETVKESALESKTVRFSWNAKSEAYDVKFAGGEGDADLLEGLAEDVDFRACLPKDDVKVGDTWKVDGKLFNHLLDIGGDVKFREAGKESKEDKNDFSRQLDANMSGAADLKFEEVREKDGLRLAVLNFKAEFKSHAEVEDGGLHAEVELEPEGEILWDLAANRIHALDITGKLTMSMKGDQSLGKDGSEAHTLHIEVELEGTMGLEVSTK